MGVEPTRRPSRGVHAGFEDQGGHRTPCASAADSTRVRAGRVRRVLFAEGKDEASLRGLAARHDGPWRLLARPEQGLFLLEATDPGEELERQVGSSPGVRAWVFDVVAEGPPG